jgi:DNA mismatch repair protein MutL
MADVIRLLPDNIANQIAAGEVVQRPASIVKELLENSVDAGALNVRLYVKDGGKSLVQVIDDGKGMSETDARMCFERHATSKIQTLQDLYEIYTLGFRGEALASIAAVAHVELRTRRKEDEIGAMVQIENSEILKHEPFACTEGTSISVKRLFYNVPARRNFLKSDSVEMRHIVDEFLRVALAHPEVGFYLFNEDEELYHLRPGNLKQRIVSIWGKKYEEHLVPIDEKTDILTISGFIGKPDSARKTRGEQFFFANGRFIRNNYLHHAVMAAYEGLLPVEVFPFYTIFMELAPSRIDINVHPTKTEIKFEDEKAIYAMLRSAVRRSLSQYHIAPALNFDEETSMPLPVSPGPKGEFVRTGISTHSGGFSGGTSSDPILRQSRAKPEEWEELYKILSTATSEEKEGGEEVLNVNENEQKPVLQLQNKFIVSSIRSGLMVIHQSLAHERVLFERYTQVLQEARPYSQRLLFPEVLHFQGPDFALIKDLLPQIRALGFDLEEFGKDAFVLNGVPIDFQSHEPAKLVEQLLETYKNDQGAEKLTTHERLAGALARNGAIKVGRSLSTEEMRSLIDELFACAMPYYSPGGQPTLMTLSIEELDKKFKK